MKTILMCILLLALLGACGRQSQEEEYTPTPPPYEDEYTEYEEPEPPTPEPVDGIHGLLSVVEFGQNRAYILGSIHVGREDWYPLSSIVEEAIEMADVFAFEIDLGATGGPCLCDAECNDCDCDPDGSDCICLLMELMFLPEGETLASFLPEEDFSMFMEAMQTFPVSMDALAPLRPTTIMELIMYQIVAPGIGLSSEHSIDMYVFNRAEALGRPVIGLTDFNDHIAFVSGMPDEYQFATARYFSDFETMTEEIRELAYIYETQDIETLIQMIRTDMSEAYEAYHAGEISTGGLGLARYWHYTVGNYRSTFFANQIARLLIETEEPTTFFVTIGIAHLTREVNVFYTLEELGFEPKLLVMLD